MVSSPVCGSHLNVNGGLTKIIQNHENEVLSLFGIKIGIKVKK